MALCHTTGKQGSFLNSKLWTAKILAEQPELIKQVHKNYFKAGADCGITCSYQASIPGLMENGYTLEEAENLIRSAVKIFVKQEMNGGKKKDVKLEERGHCVQVQQDHMEHIQQMGPNTVEIMVLQMNN